MITKCTIGNGKLRLENSSGISAEFEPPNGEKVMVTANSSFLNRLKNELLTETATDEELRKLSHLVFSMLEEEVFILRRK